LPSWPPTAGCPSQNHSKVSTCVDKRRQTCESGRLHHLRDDRGYEEAAPRNSPKIQIGRRCDGCRQFAAAMESRRRRGSARTSAGAAVARRLLGSQTMMHPPDATMATPGALAVTEVTAILAMPLDQFAREGQCLEIRVPWHSETLWFVPDERDARRLGSQNVG